MSAETTARTGAIDPITYEVLTHRLWSIDGEGATTIIHASGSPVVHSQDYNFGLYAANGDLAMCGVFYTLPLFVMQQLIKEILARHGETLKPGDVFISNDPFLAGVHQSDIQFAAPFFHDGKLVGWTGCMAHVMDVGGMNPGSWCPGATEVHQEGLLIPMARIVDAGVTNTALWDTIMANSRLPAMLANDFSAFLSAHRVSQARLREACEEFGADIVAAVMDEMVDRTAGEMTAWLAKLPDGEFQHVGYLDHDGRENRLYRVDCVLRKRGERLAFDFSGSDDAVEGMVNATASGTMGAVGSVILATFGSELAWNAGLMRAVDVVTRPNSIVSAESPLPISAGSVAAAWVAAAAAMSCLGKLLSCSPEYADFACGPADGSFLLSQFGGRNQYGEPFATMFMDAEGRGGSAFRFRDGNDTGGSLVSPGGGFGDVEQHELHQPILYLWRRERRDSGGAGRNRGGNGIEYALAIHGTDEVTATNGTQGVEVPLGIGFFGASPAGTSRYELAAGSDWRARLAAGGGVEELAELEAAHRVLAAKSTSRLAAGDVLNHATLNGGGYGDPLEREPERVLGDVLRGSVGAAAAASLYGVAIEDGAIDAAATERARREIRERRLAALPADREYRTAELPVVARFGDGVAVVRDGEELLVQSVSSGAVLGPLGDNWRDAAPSRAVDPAELGPHIHLHAELQIRQYLDPLDGRSLWIDVVRPGDPLPVDFRLENIE